MEQQQNAENGWLLYKRSISAELNIAAVNLADLCSQHYIKHKADNRLLTFNDLIPKTLNLMRNSAKAPGLLYDLDYGIDHILVDEAQDNNPHQWQLIDLLSEEFFAGITARTVNRTVFIVGDIKQSIFSFQGANPELFQKAVANLEYKALNAFKEFHKLSMQLSFRSIKQVLDLVNTICKFNPMYPNFDAIDHQAFREGTGIVQLWPLFQTDKDDKQSQWRLPKPTNDNKEGYEKTAAYICDTIVSWINDKRQLASRKRPIFPSDIIILVRKRGPIVNAIRRNLAQKRISVVESYKTNLKDNLIIQDILSLIAFIVDQEDDFNLACLLKSPFIEADEDQLFKVCYQRPYSLWQQIKISNSIYYPALDNILELSKQCTLLQLILDVIYHQDKLANFLNRFGDEANQIISSLIEIIHDYENKNGQAGYAEFIGWFNSIDIEVQLNRSSSTNAVQIMTVHSAKGLQAPIVILADAASTEYKPIKRIFSHQDLPIISLSAQYDDELINLLKKEDQLKEAHENNRLLYVALTRAEDELYITGINTGRLKGSWYDIVAKNI